LGKISPIGRLITLGSFYNYVQKHIFLGYFFQGKGYILCNNEKYGLGYILGHFFTNSSCHPDAAADPFSSIGEMSKAITELVAN
jgi:hypothetical protein